MGVTLDQFRVFVEVVEKGSFAAAARNLGRTQSAITYTIQKLEAQTGLDLFDRDSYRPLLTESGKSLLPHARKVLADVSEFSLVAGGIAQGLEASLTVAISQFAPQEPVFETLKRFQAAFPTVWLRITILTTQTSELLDNGSADLALLPEFIPFGSDYLRKSCGFSRLVAVAAPQHPLARIAGRITPDMMREHAQIITAGRHTDPRRRNFAQQALNCWEVNDIGTKRLLILNGIGWGGLPEYLVEDDLRNGGLAALDPTEWDGLDHLPNIEIVFAHRHDRPLGPAGQWLFEELSNTMSSPRPHAL